MVSMGRRMSSVRYEALGLLLDLISITSPFLRRYTVPLVFHTLKRRWTTVRPLEFLAVLGENGELDRDPGDSAAGGGGGGGGETGGGAGGKCGDVEIGDDWMLGSETHHHGEKSPTDAAATPRQVATASGLWSESGSEANAAGGKHLNGFALSGGVNNGGIIKAGGSTSVRPRGTPTLSQPQQTLDGQSILGPEEGFVIRTGGCAIT